MVEKTKTLRDNIGDVQGLLDLLILLSILQIFGLQPVAGNFDYFGYMLTI